MIHIKQFRVLLALICVGVAIMWAFVFWTGFKAGETNLIHGVTTLVFGLFALYWSMWTPKEEPKDNHSKDETP